MSKTIGLRAPHAGQTSAFRFAEGNGQPDTAGATRLHAQPAEIPDAQLAEIASRLYRSRQRLSAYFEPGVFAAPAWDMLLVLYVERIAGKRTSTISLCLAAGVPSTSGLRWIGRLTDRGLVRRYKVPHDNRLTMIELTHEGSSVMRRYLVDGIARSLLQAPD